MRAFPFHTSPVPAAASALCCLQIHPAADIHVHKTGSVLQTGRRKALDRKSGFKETRAFHNRKRQSEKSRIPRGPDIKKRQRPPEAKCAPPYGLCTKRYPCAQRFYALSCCFLLFSFGCISCLKRAKSKIQSLSYTSLLLLLWRKKSVKKDWTGFSESLDDPLPFCKKNPVLCEKQPVLKLCLLRPPEKKQKNRGTSLKQFTKTVCKERSRTENGIKKEPANRPV